MVLLLMDKVFFTLDLDCFIFAPARPGMQVCRTQPAPDTASNDLGDLVGIVEREGSHNPIV